MCVLLYHGQDLSPRSVFVFFVFLNCLSRFLRSRCHLFPGILRLVGGGFALGFPWQQRAQRTHSWEEMCWPVSPHYDPLLAKHKHLSLYLNTCGSLLPVSEGLHDSHRNTSRNPSEGFQILNRLCRQASIIIMSTFEFAKLKLHVEVWKSFAQSKVFLFSQDNSDKELRTLPPPQVCFGIASCSTMSEMFCHDT